MATKRVCDYCGEVIEQRDEIFIRVDDMMIQLSSIAEDEDRPLPLGRGIDLHRQCYIDHYQTNIDQTGTQT